MTIIALERCACCGHQQWFKGQLKPREPLRNYAHAVALLLAEIRRLGRTSGALELAEKSGADDA